MAMTAGGHRGRLQQSVARHSTAALVVFMAAAAGVLSVAAVQSMGIVTAIIGVVGALALALSIPLLLDLRNPYFRTRTDVERVLELPVLATRRARRDG